MPHPSSHRLDLLLDTHVVLWWLESSKRLTQRTRQAIVSADRVLVSAASIWELSIKIAKGNLTIQGDLEHHILATGFDSLPVTMPHALAAARLPRHHGDPFDRMLVAQASIESLTLMTADPEQAKYGISVMLL
jgi:PIN domain nuclease of toxin-antitoxin system